MAVANLGQKKSNRRLFKNMKAINQDSIKAVKVFQEMVNKSLEIKDLQLAKIFKQLSIAILLDRLDDVAKDMELSNMLAQRQIIDDKVLAINSEFSFEEFQRCFNAKETPEQNN